MKTESDYPPNLHTALSRPPRSPLVASKVLASSITSSNITCNPGIISSEGLHQVAWSGLQRDIIPFTMAPASPTHHIQDPLLALTDSGILGFVTYNLKFTRQQDIGKLKFAGIFFYFFNTAMHFIQKCTECFSSRRSICEQKRRYRHLLRNIVI